jgi:hypothetical protein
MFFMTCANAGYLVSHTTPEPALDDLCADALASSTSPGSPLLSPALRPNVQGSSPSPTASATSAPWREATSFLPPGARPTPTPRQSLESQQHLVSSFSHSCDGTWSGSIARWTKRQGGRTWPWRLSRHWGVVKCRLRAMLWLGGIRSEASGSNDAQQRQFKGFCSVRGPWVENSHMYCRLER